MRNTVIFPDDADLFDLRDDGEIEKERKQVEEESLRLERKLKELEEKSKLLKARKAFVPKSEFLIRVQINKMTDLIHNIDTCLKLGDRSGLQHILNQAVYNVNNMNVYMATDNRTDILYDYMGAETYTQIKDNVSSERTNKGPRVNQVRETNWVQFSSRKQGEDSSRDN